MRLSMDGVTDYSCETGIQLERKSVTLVCKNFCYTCNRKNGG